MMLRRKNSFLQNLNQAVIFEQFLQTKYVGQKRFSLEGGEALIPALSTMMFNAVNDYNVEECVVRDGTSEVV